MEHSVLDNVLSPWAGRLRCPLLVKYDPRNLSRIYVRDPDGKHWPVPYADLGQPPIALWELEEANNRTRKSVGASSNEHTLFASILEQRRLVQKAESLSKQRRRREKMSSTEEPVIATSRVSTNTFPGQEIHPYPVELWEGE